MNRIVKYLIESATLTLQYHDELNSKLWKNEKLRSDVSNKLIMIARTWAGFAKIPPKAIKDVILVGGNANFNYTPYSDIDLHVVVDMDKIPECKQLLDEYLRDKKQLWGLVHDIKIYGHDVELYAQDKNTPYTKDQGVYSIKQDKWLVQPTKKEVNLNDPAIKRKVEQYIEKINTLIETSAEDGAFETLKTKFREMRAAALKQGGEFSIENLVFKELRNLGYLNKITEYLRSKQDQRLSL
jgi:predicted nucleotidyltransferase